ARRDRAARAARPRARQARMPRAPLRPPARAPHAPAPRVDARLRHVALGAVESSWKPPARTDNAFSARPMLAAVVPVRVGSGMRTLVWKESELRPRALAVRSSSGAAVMSTGIVS